MATAKLLFGNRLGWTNHFISVSNAVDRNSRYILSSDEGGAWHDRALYAAQLPGVRLPEKPLWVR